MYSVPLDAAPYAFRQRLSAKWVMRCAIGSKCSSHGFQTRARGLLSRISLSVSMPGTDLGRPIWLPWMNNVPGRMRSAFGVSGLSSAWTGGPQGFTSHLLRCHSSVQSVRWYRCCLLQEEGLRLVKRVAQIKRVRQWIILARASLPKRYSRPIAGSGLVARSTLPGWD